MTYLSLKNVPNLHRFTGRRLQTPCHPNHPFLKSFSWATVEWERARSWTATSLTSSTPISFTPSAWSSSIKTWRWTAARSRCRSGIRRVRRDSAACGRPSTRGSDCCLLTFSVDDTQSFQNLNNWRKEFIFYADVKEPDSFPFVVLGNKVDVTERQVSSEEAQEWCRESGGYPYFETSAKDATNVADAFEEAVRRVLALEDRNEHLIPTDTVNLHRKPRSSTACC